MSEIHDDRHDGIDEEIEREERLAEKFFEKYQETGSPSSEITARRHERIADIMRKGRDADRHARNRAAIANYVLEIDTQDLIRCGQQVRRLQKRVEEGDFT